MIKKILDIFFNKEKKQEIKQEIKQEVKQEIKQEEIQNKYEDYITYYEDGSIKEKGKKNHLGIDGLVTIYDRSGNEIEKVEYSNGLYLGNPFKGKSPDEIIEILGLEVDETGNYNDLPGEEFEIDEKVASTLLK